MTAYWIGLVNVTKPEQYAEYGKLAGPAIQKHGGKFLARGGKSTTLEGARMRGNDQMWGGGHVTVDRSDLAARGDSAQLDLAGTAAP